MISLSCLFSETYCGGYSGEDPPLPIPSREVKLTIADGTAPPGGRVGSCHFLIQVPDITRCRGLLILYHIRFIFFRPSTNYIFCRSFTWTALFLFVNLTNVSVGTAVRNAWKVLLVPSFRWGPRAETWEKCSRYQRSAGDCGQKGWESALGPIILVGTTGRNKGKVLLVPSFRWGPRSERLENRPRYPEDWSERERYFAEMPWNPTCFFLFRLAFSRL